MTIRQKTVVIRLPQDRPSVEPLLRFAAPAALPEGMGDTPNELNIEIEEMSDAERADASREQGALVAPAMPFAPIAPFEPTNAGAAAPQDNWGIDAVGASALPEDAGRGVTVAILDTGISPDHPAFNLNKRLRLKFR